MSILKKYNVATSQWEPIVTGVIGPTGATGPTGLTGATGATGTVSLESPAFTGTPTAPTATAATNTTQLATTAFVRTEVANLVASAPAALDTLDELASALGDDANFATTTATAIGLKAPIASPTFTGTVTIPTGASITAPTGLVKGDVGLGNADNTSDVNKPVSTAQQTALNLKANLADPTFTGTVSGVTKSMVGLGNVDNTADTAKPVSTAQQTALNLKANLSAPTFTGNVTISSGNLITGSRPSFYAVHGAGNDLASGIQAFTSVQSNIGSCYNSSNGRFTATIAGQYQFQGKLLSTNSANLSCELRKNNAYVQYSEMSRTGNNFIEISFVAVITLAVGDYMTIYSPVNVYGYAYSNFSGFFIG